ncbi:MAG: imidazoleglycerol-phosphate dehydratase HisB [Thermodesulfovibrio sp.]|nr:imidazoleglycerol-phosphate dehydratase HisB [Thermodesulfovibrio sp.]
MRVYQLERKTKETEIKVELNIDGSGKSDIKTPIGFLNHMLELWSFHGKIDLTVNAKGDTDVDYHHLIEDIGIVIGMAINGALAERRGIRRYGFASIPMDEALSFVTLDLGGRSYLIYNVPFRGYIKDINIEVFEEFFKALVSNAKMILHINVLYGKDLHHIVESIFKAFAKAFKEAITVEDSSIPSTKGVI